MIHQAILPAYENHAAEQFHQFAARVTFNTAVVSETLRLLHDLPPGQSPGISNLRLQAEEIVRGRMDKENPVDSVTGNFHPEAGNTDGVSSLGVLLI